MLARIAFPLRQTRRKRHRIHPDRPRNRRRKQSGEDDERVRSSRRQSCPPKFGNDGRLDGDIALFHPVLSFVTLSRLHNEPACPRIRRAAGWVQLTPSSDYRSSRGRMSAAELWTEARSHDDILTSGGGVRTCGSPGRYDARGAVEEPTPAPTVTPGPWLYGDVT